MIPRIIINEDSVVQADVARLVITRDANGNVVSQVFNQIYGLHRADVQLLTSSDRFANEQLKIEVTHRVFPEPYLVGIVQVLNDFFRVGNEKFRIKTIHDFRTLAYFDVFLENIGVIP